MSGVQKKSRCDAIRAAKGRSEVKTVTTSALCRLAGVSRQAYYQGRRQRRRKARAGEGILEAVRCERLEQPRVGTRKLQHLLGAGGLAVGRDYLFELLG